MTARWVRGAAGGLLAGAVLMGTAGCSDDGDNAVSGAVSEAASAVASAAEGLSEAASQAVKKAEEQMAEIKDGVDAKDEVTLGDPATDADGRTTVPLTVRNTGDATRSFAVQVQFKDGDGKLLDAVVVTISDVPAGKPGDGTARSTHRLSGTVTPSVASALRY
ncbi:hypothetical protein HHL19_23840 [Streptomyces sp. R302]|uniref:hypothetical protein n=1 Tax=unclassified Streptomyces TaxID=2593676 RepID=UPI00145DB544|nr:MULTISPECIES: hypothetical protein [unclassified Streptomyces]NML51981.1 hypothetical protein [Streptomyces sp. R301]NML81601.1 hypothetical protein [Streptomyces sp. R302]